MTCLRDLTPNMPFDPTVSLPRLRLGRMSAGQRQRSPHGDRFLKPEDTNGS